jgi:hypothetical protein
MNEEKLKRRWQKEDEFKIESAVSKFITDAEGRKFLWWLLEIGRIGGQPYSGNALNTAFNCGELNVGQRILDRIISVSPDGYLKMMKENEDERKARDTELNQLIDGTLDAEADESGEETR